MNEKEIAEPGTPSMPRNEGRSSIVRTVTVSGEAKYDIDLALIDDELSNALKPFDFDKNNLVSLQEVATGARLLVESRKKTKQLGKSISYMILGYGVLIASIGILVYFIVEVSKDTRIITGGELVVATGKEASLEPVSVNTNEVLTMLAVVPFLSTSVLTHLSSLVMSLSPTETIVRTVDSVDIVRNESFVITTTVGDTLVWESQNMTNDMIDITLSNGDSFRKNVMCAQCVALNTGSFDGVDDALKSYIERFDVYNNTFVSNRNRRHLLEEIHGISTLTDHPIFEKCLAIEYDAHLVVAASPHIGALFTPDVNDNECSTLALHAVWKNLVNDKHGLKTMIMEVTAEEVDGYMERNGADILHVGKFSFKQIAEAYDKVAQNDRRGMTYDIFSNSCASLMINMGRELGIDPNNDEIFSFVVNHLSKEIEGRNWILEAMASSKHGRKLTRGLVDIEDLVADYTKTGDVTAKDGEQFNLWTIDEDSFNDVVEGEVSLEEVKAYARTLCACCGPEDGRRLDEEKGCGCNVT